MYEVSFAAMLTGILSLQKLQEQLFPEPSNRSANPELVPPRDSTADPSETSECAYGLKKVRRSRESNADVAEGSVADISQGGSVLLATALMSVDEEPATLHGRFGSRLTNPHSQHLGVQGADSLKEIRHLSAPPKQVWALFGLPHFLSL